MQKLITKYGLAAHLALLAVAPLFLSPTTILWLSGMVAIWVLMEPSKIGGEMQHEARARVSGRILHDPLFWVMLVLVIMAGIRMANGGISRTYNAETGKWFLSSANFPILPGSADGCGYPEFAMVVAMTVVLQGCRHALGKSARLVFMIVAPAIAGGMVLADVWQVAVNDSAGFLKPVIDAGLENPSFIGAIFGVHLVAATIAVFGLFDEGWFMPLPLAMVGVSGCFAGMFLFAPAYVSVLFAGAALLAFLYAFVYARIKVVKAAEFRYMVLLGLMLVIGWMLVMVMLKSGAMQAKLAAFQTGEFFSAEFKSLRELLNAASLKCWRNCPWLGSGLGSFITAISFNLSDAEWPLIPATQSAPLNGYWMLLVERGTIGAFMMSCPLALLLATYFIRLVCGIRHHLPHPAILIGICALIAAALEAVVDISFLSPGMLIALAAYLAISASSFPKEKKHHG